MKLRDEFLREMENASTDYLDWEELYFGDKEKSGLEEATASYEGFKHAILFLSLKGYLKKEEK